MEGEHEEAPRPLALRARVTPHQTAQKRFGVLVA